jgi:hypothetical protein
MWWLAKSYTIIYEKAIIAKGIHEDMKWLDSSKMFGHNGVH